MKSKLKTKTDKFLSFVLWEDEIIQSFPKKFQFLKPFAFLLKGTLTYLLYVISVLSPFIILYGIYEGLVHLFPSLDIDLIIHHILKFLALAVMIAITYFVAYLYSSDELNKGSRYHKRDSEGHYSFDFQHGKPSIFSYLVMFAAICFGAYVIAHFGISQSLFSIYGKDHLVERSIVVSVLLIIPSFFGMSKGVYFAKKKQEGIRITFMQNSKRIHEVKIENRQIEFIWIELPDRELDEVEMNLIKELKVRFYG